MTLWSSRVTVLVQGDGAGLGGGAGLAPIGRVAEPNRRKAGRSVSGALESG